MHRHDKVWIEVYKKDREYFCCKCEEKYEFPHVATLTGVTARPNNRTYFEIYELFNGKILRLNIQPCTDPANWDSYGHRHNDTFWNPIRIDGKVCCPECLEESPANQIFMSVEEIANAGLKPFKVRMKKKGEAEEIVQIHYV